MKQKNKTQAAPVQSGGYIPGKSARWCPLCGALHGVEKGAPSPWPHITRDQIEAFPALLSALEDVELRTTQARIASTIGSQKHKTDFLRGELERIAKAARAAIALAKGGAQ